MQDIQTAFDKVAGAYANVSVFQREVGRRLLERLQYLQIEPKTILDLGCGSGELSRQIKQLYPKAQVLGCDLSSKMIAEARASTGWRRKPHWFVADMQALPLMDASVDLVLSNQAIHWCHSHQALFKEVNRVLSQQGVFLFSTLGPNSFLEIRQSWQGVDDARHVNDFIDMHDVGDILSASGLMEPVIDMEMIALMYPDCSSLCRDLKAQGVRNVNPKRPSGLTGKRRWQCFVANYQQFADERGLLPLSYEVVYGHAFAGKTRSNMASGESEVAIPLSEIPIRRG